MNEQLKKNRRTIVFLFALTIVPFCIAWLLLKNANLMGEGTNLGTLIKPPVTTEIAEFIGFDQFSTDNIKELPGHWVLINVIPNKECNQLCQQALHKTRQLRLMMNKDLVRIRRAVVIIPDINSELARQWWKDDLRLLRIKPKASLINKLTQARGGDVPDGMLFLMDPLGNLMMQYDPEFDPYKVKKDLGKLLRVSQIG